MEITIINIAREKGIKNYVEREIILCIAMHGLLKGNDTESYTKKLFINMDLSFNRMNLISEQYQQKLSEIKLLPYSELVHIDKEIDKIVNGTKQQKEMIHEMTKMLETEYENIPF